MENSMFAGVVAAIEQSVKSEISKVVKEQAGSFDSDELVDTVIDRLLNDSKKFEKLLEQHVSSAISDFDMREIAEQVAEHIDISDQVESAVSDALGQYPNPDNIVTVDEFEDLKKDLAATKKELQDLKSLLGPMLKFAETFKVLAQQENASKNDSLPVPVPFTGTDGE